MRMSYVYFSFEVLTFTYTILEAKFLKEKIRFTPLNYHKSSIFNL
jgi:hypothetical protein